MPVSSRRTKTPKPKSNFWPRFLRSVCVSIWIFCNLPADRRRRAVAKPFRVEQQPFFCFDTPTFFSAFIFSHTLLYIKRKPLFRGRCKNSGGKTRDIRFTDRWRNGYFFVSDAGKGKVPPSFYSILYKECWPFRDRAFVLCMDPVSKNASLKTDFSVASALKWFEKRPPFSAVRSLPGSSPCFRYSDFRAGKITSFNMLTLTFSSENFSPEPVRKDEKRVRKLFFGWIFFDFFWFFYEKGLEMGGNDWKKHAQVYIIYITKARIVSIYRRALKCWKSEERVRETETKRRNKNEVQFFGKCSGVQLFSCECAVLFRFFFRQVMKSED